MVTTRTLTGAAAILDLHLPIGQTRVTVDPAAAGITVVLSTTDDTGPAVEAIRDATERFVNGRYQVRVPEIDAPMVISGGNTVVTGGNFAGGGVFVSQSVGTVYGEVTAIQINGNRVRFGGSAGQSVTAGILAEVTIPAGVALAYDGMSAGLTVTGHLVALRAETVSGGIRLDSVEAVSVDTTSGRFEAEAVFGPATVNTVSGRVEVGSYQGSDARISTVSGRVELSAGGGSRGVLRVETVSGRIELRGTDRLTVQASTVSGRKSIS